MVRAPCAASIVFGTLTSSRKVASHVLTLNAVFFNNGDVSGTMILYGSSNRLIIVGKTAFERLSLKTLQKVGVAPSEASQLANRWVKGPNSVSEQDALKFHIAVGTSFGFASILKVFSTNFGSLREAGTYDIAGIRTERVVAPSGVSLWIAINSPHYPVNLTLEEGRVFLDYYLPAWGVGRTPTPPKGAIPISSLHVAPLVPM